MYGIDELTRVLLPPIQPLATGSPDEWNALEKRLGWALPSDYKEFITTYGAGAIDDWCVWILSPFDANPAGNLENRLLEHNKAHAVSVQFTDEPENLIPWADTDIRGMCFWETNEVDPDKWTVFAAIDDDTHRWPENMVTFLRRVIMGEHMSAVFGNHSGAVLPLSYNQIPR